MAAITDKQNVFFKHGTQTKYDGLSNRDSGTFYVTTDTHRLYLGDNLLSQAVQTVANVASLPAASDARREKGQIYYAEAENVLAVYDTAKGWVQLNPDTFVSAFTAVASSLGANGGASLTLSLDQNNKDTIAATIDFIGTNGIAISTDTTDSGDQVIKFTLPVMAVGGDDDEATISLNGVTAKFVGGDNVVVSEDGGTITIESDYNDTVVDSAQLVGSPVYDKDGNAGNGFTISGTIELANNHDGTDTVAIGEGTIDPNLTIVTNRTSEGSAITGLPIHFVGGTAALDVYSTSYIDNALQNTLNQVNAMTYRGKLDKEAGASVINLPTENVHIGDTWILGTEAKVQGPGTPKINDIYLPGTLFIAGGTETDGVITSNLKYDAVLTSDHDTTYELKTYDGSTVVLESSVEDQIPTAIKFVGGNKLNATIKAAGKESDGFDGAVITFNHDAVAKIDKDPLDATETTKEEQGLTKEFTIIEDIVQDGYGHLQTLKTRSIKVLDTVVELDEGSSTLIATDAGDGSKVTLNQTIADTNKNTLSYETSFESETLQVTKSGDTGIKAELVWGTF